MSASKQADLLPSVSLQQHQQDIFDQSKTNKGVRKLLYWQLGSGKSLGGLAAAEAIQQPYTVVAPASLRETWKKERQKFTDQQTPADIISYTAAAKGFPATKLDTVIADESHRLRNPQSQQTANVARMANQAKNLLLLTGTPVVNSPGDIAPLTSMLTGQKMSPAEFEQRFIKDKEVRPGLLARMRGIRPGVEHELQNEDQLKALLQGHVDYYSPSGSTVPTKHEDIEVEMSPKQTQLYKAMMDELPWMIRWKLKRDFPLSSEELNRLRSFLTGPRQVGLSTLPFLHDKDPSKAFSQSTKLQTAHQNLTEKLKDERVKALVFSNFIDAGLTPYSHALEQSKIPHGVFHGGLSDAQRKKLVDDYNTNKIRVALLGPSGAEGLSFRGTQLVQILDPYWHNVRTRQQQGRGLRFDSHEGLPEDLKNVTVQRYTSKVPLGRMDRMLERIGFDRSLNRRAADDHLKLMSEKKDKLNERFLQLLKEEGMKKQDPTSYIPGKYEQLKPQEEEQQLSKQEETRKGLLRRLYESVFGQSKRAEDLTDTVPVELPSKKKVSILDKLREAKFHSDNRNWSAKHQIIRDMMEKNPNVWDVSVDPNVPPYFAGIMHVPTGWRFHYPRNMVPASVYLDIRSRKTKPITIDQ